MSLPASYFDEIYDASDDPWSLRTRRYEARKRSLTLDALLDERYRTVYEPGCSVGVLTADLARRADHVLAMDVSSRALQLARSALPDHVDLVRGALPQDWPERHFDLVVLSEVAYYFDAVDCRQVADSAMRCAEEVIAVHWRHPVEDYPLSGDDAHRIIGEAAGSAGFVSAVQHQELDFLLGVWAREGASVARRTGLLAT